MSKIGLAGFLGFTVLWLAIRPSPGHAQETMNTCLNCHLELDDELRQPAVKIAGDVHNIEGLSCTGCHGGDPTSDDAEDSMSKARGFRGTPTLTEIPEFCGRCHSDPAFMRKYNPTLPTDQLDKYWTSHHGQLMKKGEDKAAQCVSCHGVHDIKMVTDPRSTVYAKNVPQTCAHCHANQDYMAGYKIPTNQYDEYKASVHGEALLVKDDTGAPACNDCHGNHAAMPPGVTSIGRICFQCHLAEGELFMSSPHKPAFDALGEAECSFCHGNHAIHRLSDENLGVADKSLCMECHSEGDPGYQAAKSMKEAVVALRGKYEEAIGLIDAAEMRGVEVSDEQFKLIEVRNSLVNVRTLLHAFNADTLISSADVAMATANEVYQAGEQSIAEVKNRRTGFFIFTIVTVFLIIVLVVKVRRMERR